MSALYLIALCAFSLVMLALVFEALVSVARKPQWQTHRRDDSLGRVERRTQNLPFVGAERRADLAAAHAEHASALPDERREAVAKAA